MCCSRTPKEEVDVHFVLLIAINILCMGNILPLFDFSPQKRFTMQGFQNIGEVATNLIEFRNKFARRLGNRTKASMKKSVEVCERFSILRWGSVKGYTI